MARQIEGPWFRASKGTWHTTLHGRSVSLRVKGQENKSQAQQAWHRLMAEGAKPIPEPKLIESITVKELVNAFVVDAETRLKPNTVRIYRYDLATLCELVGNFHADKLTPQHVTKWLHGLKVNSTTKAMTLRSVSACLGWAERNDMIPLNVAKKVAKPKSRSRCEDAVISEADHAKLMEHATPDFRIVLRVLHNTGCRPGEACKITTDTFDPINGVVKLTDHKADRTGKPRLIFLLPELRDLLNQQTTRFVSGALLRSNKGVAWTGRSITQAMKRLSKKASVKAIAYGYRHSFATAALSKGVPDAHVAALLGHSSTAMLHRHYSHLTSQAQTLRDALGKIR